LNRAVQSGAVRLEVGWKTDVGLVRKNNEDSVATEADAKLFIISDGMGGEAHGEVASAIAVDVIRAHCNADDKAGDATVEMGAPQVPGFSASTNELGRATHEANAKIYESAQQNPSRRGMGATAVAVWVQGRDMSIVNVGDSRAYLFRDNALVQLTEDHTLVAEQVRRGLITPEQAKRSRVQNVLVRALGVRDEVEPDLYEEGLMAGDVVLLCTDGLTRMVADDAIAAVLREVQNPQAAADRLVKDALERGGEDNVTVIVLRVFAD
jgi:serine/threonine protein phosphatase PrpC